jgi:peptidyl-tRNA hydrolase
MVLLTSLMTILYCRLMTILIVMTKLTLNLNVVWHGNRLINIPSLVAAIEQNTACKSCMEELLKELFEKFLKYCDAKVSSMKKLSSNLPMFSQWSLIMDELDVRKWHEEWQKKQVVSVQSNIHIKEVTHGLATNLELCKVLCTLKDY